MEISLPSLVVASVLFLTGFPAKAEGLSTLSLPKFDPMRATYSARVWQTDEGLPNNRVQSIAQTPDGFLWIGTAQGLARFDGVEFKLVAATNIPALRGGSVSALCTSSDGTVWIGVKNVGLIRAKDDSFSLLTTNDGLAANNIRCLAAARDGAIWIGTTQGLSCYRSGKFKNFLARDGLSSDVVNCLGEDGRGVVWIGTARGLNRTAGDSIAKAAFLPEGDDEPVRSLGFGRDGKLWIGAARGLLIHSIDSGEPETVLSGLPDNFVWAIYADHEGGTWVGTSSGLNRFVKGNFQPMPGNNGLPYDQVNVLFEGTRGELWVGSREGLIRLMRQPFSVVTTREGLSHNQTTSVLESRHGDLWVGTWGGGVNRISAAGTKVYGKTNALSSNLIKALCEDHEGNIWVGTDLRGGLFRISDQGVSHFDERNGLMDSTISVLHEDRDGNLWIGTRYGLCRRTAGTFVTETNAAGRPIWAMCEDEKGRMWFGGDDGLFTRSNGIIARMEFPNESVSALNSDAADEVWVGTRGGGLMRLAAGKWQRFGTKDGLLSNEILGLCPAHGWLWMTSGKGIFRVNQTDLTAAALASGKMLPCVTYGKADGLDSIVCANWSAPTIWKTSDDRLCFATTIGLAVIDAGDMSADLSPPRVYIEGVEVDRKPVSLAEGDLSVPPSRGELDIRYTALDMPAPEKCRFKFRLDGVDADWIDADTHRTAHYSHVDPGVYSFHVLARNKDGFWSEKGASLKITLRPHFWQTSWFRVFAVAAVALMAGGSARFVTKRKMERKLERAERQHAIERERGRIAQDIHDDLGASLTRIMLLGLRTEKDLAARKEIGPHVQKIIAFSRATIQAMDEIVWAVNPRNDNLDGLVGYLNEYAVQMFQDSQIRCRLQMPVTSQVGLSTEIRHDLFLAVKEALNNVLKHSRASEVHLEIFTEGPAIHIIINDNGCGFASSPDPAAARGNGLGNIRKRMEAIGGWMEIATAPGQGTRLRLTVRAAAGVAAN